MAITGRGTEQDPFIVHNYSEFISLSGHEPITGTEAVYIKFFDTPNQVIDCNDYGSEFTWDAFTGNARLYGKCTYYIDLNGCTIKNFLIKAGTTMFSGEDQQTWNGSHTWIKISNGSFRNVFMGSATSKFIGMLVTLQDVSVSINIAGTTSTPFEGGNGNGSTIDNSALYIVTSTLATQIMNYLTVSDTDIELHVGNQNNKAMFPNSTFTDCRFTGKVSGIGQTFEYNTDTCVLDWCGMNSKTLNFTNCVVDLDLTDGRIAGYNFGGSKYDVFLGYNGANFNTNVVCNSHRPIDEGHESYYGRETAWNFMSHENIRNGTYLNNAGFTVVEVAGG